MSLVDILTNAPLLTAAGVGAAGTFGTYLYASKIEARAFRLERLPAITIGGAGHADGGSDSRGGAPTSRPHTERRLKVLHLSDLHLCEPESHKIRFLQQLPYEEFDVAILTGDIFENESGLQYASQLMPRLPKFGAYAVLGNHDYYAYTWVNKVYGRINRRYRHPPVKRDVQPFISALDAAGIRTLRNEAAYIEEADLHLIGIDYPGTTAQRVQELANQAPPTALKMAIFHLPRRLQHLVNAGIHIGFAGHTHGGQIRIPGYGPLLTDSELPRHEASGLVQRGETLLHISRGLSADPKTNFRLFCPPAATLVELVY